LRTETAEREKTMDESTDKASFEESYLGISPNILASFPKFRPPVALYIFNAELNQVKRYCKAEERLSKEKQQEVADLSRQGELFLARADYRVYAKLLSKKLGLVLTEPELSEQEVAEIFLEAFTARLDEFFNQPLEAMLEPLRKDIFVLCEYLWADSTRTQSFKHVLGREHSLCRHSAISCFIGLALYILIVGESAGKGDWNDIALAFMLHDIGMVNVPDYVIDNPRPLFENEKMRMREHPKLGSKMLERLKLKNPHIGHCVVQHHERLDGSGYPDRLHGDKISPVVKICAVADSFCAMTSNRVHAEAKPMTQAATELAKLTHHYEEKILRALLSYVLT